MRPVLLVVVGALLLHFAAFAQEIPATTDPPGPALRPISPEVAVVPAIEDDALAARLESIMSTTGWFEDLVVSARNGVVFIEGQVIEQEYRAWAEQLASRTDGAVAVVNRLSVRSDATSTFGMAWEEMRQFFQRALMAWPLVLVVGLILVVAWFAAKLVSRMSRRILGRRIASPLLLSVASRAVAVPVFVLGLYFVLQVAGLTRLAVTVLGGTGLIGIVLGFAFRDIAENFLASLLLSVRNPFRTGDLIEVGGHTGVVQNLNTRSTVLLTLEGTHVQIPNAIIYKSTITNYSSNASRRAEFVVGIAYDSSAAKAQTIIAGVLNDHPAVLDAPEPLVLVDELGAASVNLRVFYWFDTAAYSPAKINSAVLRLCKNALLRAGIELPDPAREIIFPKGVPIVNLSETTSGGPGRAQTLPEQVASEDTTSVTESEGRLSNETREVPGQSEGQIPGAEENLLKD